MSNAKTNKSFTKRLKLTKKGKIKSRKPGFNHFNAKQKRSKQLAGKVPGDFKMSQKDMTNNLPHHQ